MMGQRTGTSIQEQRRYPGLQQLQGHKAHITQPEALGKNY